MAGPTGRGGAGHGWGGHRRWTRHRRRPGGGHGIGGLDGWCGQESGARRRKSPWPLRTEGRARRARRRVSPLAVGGAAAVALGVVAFAVLGRGGDPVGDWESEEAALGLGVEDRVLVQRGLLELGYDPGEGDGLLGSGTRAALREWQSARGLEATGYLTLSVVDVLRVAGEQVVSDSIAEAGQLAAAEAEKAQRVSDSIARAEADAQRLAAAAERRRPGRVFRDCGTCPEMVAVPPGSYMMGSPASEAGRDGDEGPRHRVTIGYTLAVGVYEVTFAEWDACVDAGGCGGYRPEDEGWGRGSRPVIRVSWEDAREYVRWLSRETGQEYRLLSESEWEYVARAGTTAARYWGESESGQCRYANGYDQTGEAERDFDRNFVDCSDGYAETAPVGVYEANAFGLHDVLGNVWEWTRDCWNASYSGAPADGSAWMSGDCSPRVLRGGSWYNYPGNLRSANRSRNSAGDRLSGLGFRVARTIN